MELTQYTPEVSIASSRFIQENIKIAQGNSAYGTMAAVLVANMEYIDRIAETCSQFVAQSAVIDQYNKQYFNPDQKLKSFWTRNIYLDSNKKRTFENERFVTGVLTQTVTEASVKLGARYLTNWLNERDKVNTCEQIYALLNAYIRDADKNANVYRARAELNKIRNSFPISTKDKRNLYRKYAKEEAAMESLDVSSILMEENKEIRNALAYFLIVLQKQLYGNGDGDKTRLLDYYSLLDINNRYGKEMVVENQLKYDEIAADQIAYLQLSRAVVKNVFVDVPNINMEQIIMRSKAMAEYDPYSFRRKKVQTTVQGAGITIAGIIASEPELAFNGIATALAQFLPNDECLSTARQRMQTWGVSGNEFDKIVSNANSILNKCHKSDLIIDVDEVQ